MHVPAAKSILFRVPIVAFDLETFQTTLGDEKFLVWYPENKPQEQRQPKRWSVRKILQRPNCYLTATDDPEHMGPLFRDPTLRQWKETVATLSGYPFRMHAWISGASKTITTTHKDYYHNVIMVLSGKKIIYLHDDTLETVQDVDTDGSPATPYTCDGWTKIELTPGTLFYLCPATWHYVESDPQTVMCSLLWEA